ncbi:hypothetical protein [Paenibacillus sp. HB172176]|uniref:hypothetical protein n=1 Tax=Paenibacillus sp. HB172176 TaxID=2493690 RepID=UPI0014392EFC|nr:hypothetical protein [Paenibacillus sp. HB172176]
MFLTVFIIPLLLAGCRYTAAPADLLRKPDASADHLELTAAVKDVLPEYSKLMLPNKDDFKDAIRLLDIDGDRKDEAVVTFFNEYSIPQIVIFKQTGSGWKQWLLVEQPLARDIGWLKFVDVGGEDELVMLVGWVGSFDNPNVLEHYSFQAQAERDDNGNLVLRPVESIPYELAETGDLEGNGDIELALITSTGNGGELVVPKYSLAVYTLQENGMTKKASMELADTASAFQSLKIGRISESGYGIVIDGITGAHSSVTLMFAWENRKLLLVYPSRSLQAGMSRASSQDVNDDGILEVEQRIEAPGYMDTPYSEMQWINIWLQWDGEKSFHPVKTRYEDYVYDLKIDIPDSWQNRYTLKKPTAPYGLISFEYWDAMEQASYDLATVYVVPQKKWTTAAAYWKSGGIPYHQVMTDSGNIFVVSFQTAPPEGLSEAGAKAFGELLEAEKDFPSYLSIEHME